MSPQELLARLESMGIVNEQVLEKIRKQIADPDKKVKPKAMLAYLVKKNQITNSQAKKLMAEVEAPKQVQHQEMVVEQKGEDYDTGDMTAGIGEGKKEEKPSSKKKKKKVKPSTDPAATKLDTEVGGSIVRAERDPDAEPAVAGVLLDPMADALADPMYDPLSAQAGGGDPYQSGANQTIGGFAGKRNTSDQWATKWLYIGFGILGFMLIAGALLYFATSRLNAEDMYTAAIESFEKGSYGDSIKKFDEFLEKFPNDDKAPKATVVRTQAVLAQVFEGKNWKETISVAETELPKLIDADGMPLNLIREDLGVMLPTSALEISEKALKQPTLDLMEKELVVAKHAQSVVDNGSFIPPSIKKRPNVISKIEKLNNNIATVEGLIKKEYDYSDVLKEIKSLSNADKTDEAFSQFHTITNQYGDLASRKELQELMKTVSEKESKLVSSFTADMPVSQTEPDSVIGSTIVLASKTGTPMDGLQGEILPVLADGTLFGIDAGDGSVAWRRFLGYQTSIQPQMLDEETVIVCDQRTQQLIRLNAKTGALNWRTEIGEPFVSPAVSPEVIILTTRKGRVLKVDPANGNVIASVQLPQEANVGALITERRIYQPGKYSNLYILSSDNLECNEVYYLGHAPNSISVPPKNWSGNLMFAINGGKRCDLVVLRAASAGLELEPVQRINSVTNGPTNTPITRFGRWMLIAADNGDMNILQLDATSERTPITKFVEAKFENRSNQRAFYHTNGNQLWIGGKGIAQYRLQGSRGEIKRQLIVNHADSFISPMKKVGDALIHVRRRGGSGMVSVAAVDNELKEIWRTDLSGALAGSPIDAGNGLLAISSQGDLFALGPDAENRKYADNAIKSSTVIQNLRFDKIVPLSDTTYACVASDGRPEYMYIDSAAGTSQLSRLASPADKPACLPIGADGDLIVASLTGQVVRIDASKGTMKGSPFQPPVRPGIKMQWIAPVSLADSILAIGTRQGEQTNGGIYVLDARNKNAIVEMAKIEATIVSELANIGSTVYAVTLTADGQKLLAMDAAKKLAEKGQFAMPSNWQAGPWVVGSNVLVALDTDELVCLDANLAKLWTVNLPEDKLASAPLQAGNSILLPFQSGKVVAVNPQDGKPANSLDLGQPIIRAPLQKNNKLYFSGMDGTVHVVNLN